MEEIKVIITLFSAILSALKVFLPSMSEELKLSIGQIVSMLGLWTSGTNFFNFLTTNHNKMYSGLSETQIKECVHSYNFGVRLETFTIQLLEKVFASPDIFYMCLNNENASIRLLEDLLYY